MNNFKLQKMLLILKGNTHNRGFRIAYFTIINTVLILFLVTLLLFHGFPTNSIDGARGLSSCRPL